MSKQLVAYFSASGSTANVAKALALAADADLFEIRPSAPYTDADLKWTNPLARCNREKIGKKDISIAETVDAMDTYDTIFLGFPIWYYGAPNIIQSFLKAYDLSGKKIALFATSGGSDMGKTAAKLQPYLGTAQIIAEKRFDAGADVGTMKQWLETI